MSRMQRLIILGLIGLAAGLAALGATLWVERQTTRSAAIGTAAPAFTLLAGDGREVSLANYRGKTLLVFFGFTMCPDICPMTLQRVADALAQMGDAGKALTPVLISVDPERDTPALVRDYAASFGPQFVGLTGTRAQIDAVIKAYGVYAKRVDLPDSAIGYTVDHSGFLYVIGPAGQLADAIDPSMDVPALAARLGAIAQKLN